MPRRLAPLLIATALIWACAGQATAAAPLAEPQLSAVASSLALAPECVTGDVSTVDPSFVQVNMSWTDGCEYDDPFIGLIMASNDGGATYASVYELPERIACPVPGVPTQVALDLEACFDASKQPPVLGEPGYAGAYGDGWGQVKPRTVYNGGVPSGLVKKVRWRRWGKRVALGRGITFLYKPQGGYYRRPGRIQLRASRLGSCPGTDGKRAYRRLTARAQVKPGGRYGRWFEWGGDGGICGTYP